MDLTGQAGFSGLFCCSAGFLMKLTENNQHEKLKQRE